MRTRRTSFVDSDILATFGPAPALVALAAVAVGAVTGEWVPTLTIVGIAVVAYAGFLAGLTESKKAEEEQAGATSVEGASLELVDILPAPLDPVIIRVVGAQGVCALGFRPGLTWAVDRQGQLSSPLCRPAVAALGELLQGQQSNGHALATACRCPLGDRSVEFEVLRPQREPALVA